MLTANNNKRDKGDKPTIAVVIPCYRVKHQIIDVLSSLPNRIDRIYVIDDNCPQQSGAYVAQHSSDPRLTIIYHEENQGVGGAVISGYRKAIEDGGEIVVKMDGDGQMDPAHFDRIIEPLVNNDADYAKGNRFRDFKALGSMPRMRLFGNSVLSFLVKIASGYWNIVDPTNGYTAIHSNTITRLDLDKLSKRYLFESDMLINLGLAGFVVRDVDIPARYAEEESSMNLMRVALDFPAMLLRGLCKRILFRYFIFDFNMASVYLLIGVPMFAGSIIFGTMAWLDSIATGTPKSAGTIMLAALPIIVSFQMLLQAVQIDINSVPHKRK